MPSIPKPYYNSRFSLQAEIDLQGSVHGLRIGDDWSTLLNEATLELVIKDAHRDYYRDKLRGYKAEYLRVLESIESYDHDRARNKVLLIDIGGQWLKEISIPWFFDDIETLNRKKELTGALIRVTKHYLSTGDSGVLMHIRVLESFLYFDGFAHCQSAYAISSTSLKKLAYYQSRSIRNALRRRMVRRFIALLRDIRYCFRAIFRFHFKNLDDESDDLLIVNTKVATQHFSSNYNNHGSRYSGNRRDYSAFARAA